jgi:nicotinamidase-related amidase
MGLRLIAIALEVVHTQLWFRNKHDGLAAEMARTSEPPNQPLARFHEAINPAFKLSVEAQRATVCKW